MLRLLPLLLLFGPGCDARLDVSRPITLVPAAYWSAAQRNALQNAALSWNVELGTSLRMGAQGEQQVPVRSSEFVCGFTNGVTVTHGQLELQLCALDVADPDRLLPLALHELGHVLNIRDHARDPDAVMSREGGGDRRFTAEDRALFRAANPDFRPAGCAVARPVAFSAAAPVPLRTADGSFLLWGEADGIQIGRVDPGTAAVHRVGRIGTHAYPEWIRVTAAPEGLWVSWVELDDMWLVHLRLRTMTAGVPLLLDVGQHDFQKVVEVSTFAGDTDLFVAISAGLSSPTLHLYRVSRSSGEQHPVFLGPFSRSRGYLVELGPSLLLAAHHPYGITLYRLDRSSGARLATYPVVSHSGASGDDAFRAAVVGDTLLLALRGLGPVELWQVRRQGDQLLVGNRTSVESPGQGYSLISLDGDAQRLVLALNAAQEHPALEAYAVRLDGQTLQPQGKWTRLSAPDQVPSVQPRVLPTDNGAVVIWRELYDTQTIELKARCF